ncbi:hypothetical protein BOW51_07860 [Solemya velesiana gill symbiont]|uniref:Gamma-glutamyltransferase n=1 Tax=Solemya velesiana gill symbiont TaxID=1918948 RepID=A0A1T2KTY4_9GAMM|nr:hypothetical protein BOW51_07860 [Solemya velesiana gill symbiont]
MKVFFVDEHYRRLAKWRRDVLLESPAVSAQFLLKGEVPPAAHRIKQPDLADTLSLLAEQGRDGFYKGTLAKKLVEGVKAAGGIWSLDDLAQYKVVERKPVIGEYKGMRVVSAAPPSSGGIALITMLNILEGYDLQTMDEVQRKHLVVEAMRRAYRDRADFVDVPVDRLISKDYAAGLGRSISLHRATPSRISEESDVTEGTDTTHFSIIDAEGNRVSATLSINYPFSSCFVVLGTGVLLNDEMDDFSASPGVPNAYGLVGGEANAIAPGKRMLSSMTPTFVESDDGVAVLGSPGGSRIITMVLHGILELASGKGPQYWVSKGRYHHQYLPDHIQFEPGVLSGQEQEALQRMGHKLKPLERNYSNMQAAFQDRGTDEMGAASDPRGLVRPLCVDNCCRVIMLSCNVHYRFNTGDRYAVQSV